MTNPDPDQRQKEQVEKSERGIPTHPREHRRERRDDTHPLGCSFAELKWRPALNQRGPLSDSLVYEEQWRENHDNADCIARPKMKPGLGKTVPRNYSRSSIGGDKTAR